MPGGHLFPANPAVFDTKVPPNREAILQVVLYPVTIAHRLSGSGLIGGLR